MKTIFLTIFISVNSLCFANSVIEPMVVGDWSETIKGLRGRLVFSEDKKIDGTEIAVIYLELQNVSNVGNPMEIYFDTIHSQLHFQLADASNRQKQDSGGALDEMIPDSYWINLPHDSTLRFRVSWHGYGIPKDAGLAIGVPEHFWVIPANSTNNYFLSASFAASPPNDKDHIHAWNRSLVLPSVKIPAVR
jgi:hypothetical protein